MGWLNPLTLKIINERPRYLCSFVDDLVIVSYIVNEHNVLQLRLYSSNGAVWEIQDC
jgi:hypothetical protein